MAQDDPTGPDSRTPRAGPRSSPSAPGRTSSSGREGVQRRQPHRLGGRADLLRRPSRSSRRCWSWSPCSACSARPRPGAHRQPRPGRPRRRAGILTSAIEHLQQGQGTAGIARDRRPRRRAVVGVRLRRRRSCAPPTPSTTCPRAGRSGRRCRSALGVTVADRRAAGAGRRRSSWSPAGGRAGRHGLGIGRPAVTVWNIAKWPVLLLSSSCMFAILYWARPTPSSRFPLGHARAASSPCVLWLIASAGSRSTWRTSAPTTRPTAASPA